MNLSALNSRPARVIITLAGLPIAIAIARYHLLSAYLQLVLMYVGINIMLTLSLNLINGFMGEFSVGHAGFMAAGAYASSVLTVKFFDINGVFTFIFAIVLGGTVAALLGLILSVPSFRTRGDYLAIVTLAFGMMVKSGLENIDFVGGPRGFLGMDRLTTLPIVYGCVVTCVWIIRNFVYSKFGRGVLSIREDEIASSLMTVETRRVKVMAFVISAFFCGIAGALFAHLIQFINPSMFDILKSTEMLIMVYLGGIGSITGSIIGAGVYTFFLEALRPLGIWRMVIMSLLLVLLMLFRPRGIFGLREVSWLIPKSELEWEKRAKTR